MNTWLLPQTPILRRPEKASTDLFQTAMEFPQRPSQLPSSGCGSAPPPDPHQSFPAQQQRLSPLPWSQPARRTGGLVSQNEKAVSLHNFSNSIPHQSLSLALHSEKLFHKNPMERVDFHNQAIKSVFKRMAVQITDT